MSGMLDEATTAVRETGTRIKEQAGTAAGKAGKRIRDVLPGRSETRLRRLLRMSRSYLRHAVKAVGLAAAVGAATATARRKRHGGKHSEGDTTK